MKKSLLSLAAAAVALFAFTGCSVATSPVGLVYTDATTPHETTNNEGAAKEGRAECKSILSIVATGDCSIGTAAKNGGIRKIQSVDTHVNSILGIISTYTTIVRGQ